MRKYYIENNKNKSLIAIFITVIISTFLSFLLMIVFSYLIARTQLSEKFVSFAAIIVNAILAITYTATLVLKSKIKPIFCALISFLLILIIKLILNIFLSVPITLTLGGGVMLIVMLFFCVISALLFVNYKK